MYASILQIIQFCLGTISYYVNDTFISSRTATSAEMDNINYPLQQAYIGRHDNYYNAHTMASVELYDKALTQSEITANFARSTQLGYGSDCSSDNT